MHALLAVCGKVSLSRRRYGFQTAQHLEETPWHPRRFVPDIPEDFGDIIAEMMEKNADQTHRLGQRSRGQIGTLGRCAA